MKTILKFVCLISVISAVHCAQFCSNKEGKKGECLSHEVCEQNKLIPDANCDADQSCCILESFENDCEDGLPTIFMLYSHNGTHPKLFCSGTLISSVYILTAAHCIDHNSTLPLFAKIHGSDREFKISDQFSFPSYANNETHRFYDVGLFRLVDAIDPKIKVKTVCLPNHNLVLNNETFHIYGYNDDSKSIKEATTNFYDTDSCLEYLNKYNLNHSFSFQESFCYDDSYNHVPNFISGSPIMIKEGNKYYQYGITTFGVIDRANEQTIPAISPKLSVYQGWINDTATEFDDRMRF